MNLLKGGKRGSRLYRPMLCCGGETRVFGGRGIRKERRVNIMAAEREKKKKKGK